MPLSDRNESQARYMMSQPMRLQRNPFVSVAVWAICLAGALASSLPAAEPQVQLAEKSGREFVARHGSGWLEREQGLLILHVAGTPYEMGEQHGRLLKDHCRTNLNYLMKEKASEVSYKVAGINFGPEMVIGGIVGVQRPHLPNWYTEELRGLAAGAGLPLGRVERANFIPELFHCSGFAVHKTATIDGKLYHGRVLDYSTDWKLQEHAVLVIAKPDEGHPFVNITFAGFVGCVSGMNAKGISLGEMGGRGLGHWDGVPMAVLMRWALRDAATLDKALAIFRDNPRTCEYYYVAADGKTNRAVGFEASWDVFAKVNPGEKHKLLPRPVDDAVLLSAGDRYHCLVDRVKESHGQIDEAAALELMSRPVATRGNLHNVLFSPSDGRFWVSYAGEDRTPAAERPYAEFNLHELLTRQPPE